MPNKAIALEGYISDGSCTFPPTVSIGPYTATTFFGSKRIQLRGITNYYIHCKGKSCHPMRTVVHPGKCTFMVENLPVAFEGDLITCGDHIKIGQSTCGAYA